MTVKELITKLNEIEDEERDVKINLEGNELLVNDVIEPPLESVVIVGIDWDVWCGFKGKLMSNERPQGEWIYFLGCGVGRAMCSECGQLGDIKKYCGYCGAKMKLG